MQVYAEDVLLRMRAKHNTEFKLSDIYETTGFNDFSKSQDVKEISHIVRQIAYIDPYKILTCVASEDAAENAQEDDGASPATAQEDQLTHLNSDRQYFGIKSSTMDQQS